MSMATGSLAANHSARRSSTSRLCASEEGLGGEGGSVEEEQSSSPDDALLNAVGKVESPAGVDLAKGIAFEAPKAKVPAEEEKESDSKKVRGRTYCSESSKNGSEQPTRNHHRSQLAEGYHFVSYISHEMIP